MLSINTYTEIGRLVSTDFRYIDMNLSGNVECSSTFRYSNIHSAGIGEVLVPYVFNEIKLSRHSNAICGIGASEERHRSQFNVAVENITNYYDELDEDTIEIYHIYTKEIDEILNRIDTDIFKDVNDEIKALYSKANAQLELRAGLDHTPNTVLRISRTKHMLIFISDYDDYDNKTDSLLTYGLIPRLFKDCADKLEQAELNYLNELVHRSQLKRIVNSDVTNLYNEMIKLDKYNERLKELQFKRTIDRLVSTKVHNMESQKTNAYRMAEDALANYSKHKSDYYEYSRLLENLKQDTDRTKEEFITALTQPFIIDVDINDYSDHIRIGVKSTLDFYDTDALECILHNIRNEKVKKLMEKVFINGEYKMQVYTEFWFRSDTTRGSFRAPGSVDYARLYDYDCMFNPHLEYFQCLGTYKPQLIDAEAKQDLLAFVNIALASTRSINFMDGAVTNRWFDDLASNLDYDRTLAHTKCLIDSEGNLHTINDVLYEPIEEPTEEEIEVAVEEAIDLELHDTIEEEYVW